MNLATDAGLPRACLERMYRSLYLVRRVEEEVARVYPTDKVKSPIHLSIGQEAVPVGLCEALQPRDVVFGTYRSHALYLAKGGDLRRMAAELYGKAAGCAKGKGGSMHLVDVGAGVMGCSAIVGAVLPNAAGYALGCRMRGLDTVAACTFGDGAVEEGAFHESLNFAALKKLPVLFVCENNFYSIHTPLRARQPRDNIHQRAAAYDIPSERVDGNDALAVREAALRAVASIRSGAGPYFLECRTYRWKEHVGPNDDFDKGYRSIEEARPWLERDPVKPLAALLAPDRRESLEAEVDASVKDAFAYAEASPFPDESELLSDLFKGESR